MSPCNLNKGKRLTSSASERQVWQEDMVGAGL